MENARQRRESRDLDAGEFDHVGQMLTAAREAMGQSLDDAASGTHIKPHHLEAIERLNVVALPARPYAIGFVKTYAEFLDLDPRLVVERFKLDAGFEAPAPVEVEKFEPTEAASDSEKAEMSIYAVIAVIAFMIWCAYQITIPPQNVTQIGANATAPDIATPVLPFADPNDQPPLAVVVEPKTIERTEPVYPRRCAIDAAPVETVVASFTISADGRVAAEKIHETSNACLNDAVLNAVRRWRFSPQTIDGVAKPAFDQKYSFALKRP